MSFNHGEKDVKHFFITASFTSEKYLVKRKKNSVDTAESDTTWSVHNTAHANISEKMTHDMV